MGPQSAHPRPRSGAVRLYRSLSDELARGRNAATVSFQEAVQLAQSSRMAVRRLPRSKGFSNRQFGTLSRN